MEEGPTLTDSNVIDPYLPFDTQICRTARQNNRANGVVESHFVPRRGAMNRREFTTVLGGATALPCSTRTAVGTDASRRSARKPFSSGPGNTASA